MTTTFRPPNSSQLVRVFFGEEMNVLSLFDGMSCAQLALQRAGINVNEYMASELDKHAIQVTQKNFPKTIQLGDVTKIGSVENVDLLIGGSPCQGFSFAGKQLNFDDQRSKLFFEYVRILKKSKPKYFLLENVKMKKEYQDVISDLLGVHPIEINSALVSAQNRRRLYWTNIENVGQPEDKGLVLADILEGNADDSFNSDISKYDGNGQLNPSYKSQANTVHDIGKKSPTLCAGTHGYASGHVDLKSYFEKHKKELVLALKESHGRISDISINDDGIRPHQGDKAKSGISELGRIMFKDALKTYTLIASHSPKIIEFQVSENYLQYDLSGKGHKSQDQRAFYSDGKHGTIPAQGTASKIKVVDENFVIRKLTPIECERLQTIDDNYTNHVSNTQRYKMLGNAFTVDVIAHILKGIK